MPSLTLSPTSPFSRPALIATLQAASGGRPLSRRAYAQWRQAHPDAPAADTFRWRFGSWAAACAAAGVPPGSATAGAPSAALLTALRVLADTLGYVPRLADWQAWAARPCSGATVIRRFGSWRAALAAALGPLPAFRPRPPGRSPQLDALAALDAPRTPRQAAAAALARQGLGASAIAAALGISRQRVYQLGRPVTRRHSWTRAAALAALRAWAAAHPWPPRLAAWRGGPDRPGAATLVRLFGSWAAAWAAACPDRPRLHRGRPARSDRPPTPRGSLRASDPFRRL